MIVCFADVGVKENRTTLLCKKSGGNAEIREVEDQDDDCTRGEDGFVPHRVKSKCLRR